MKKCILLITTILFAISCSGVKNTQKSLSQGNYDSSIEKAIDKLSRNKTSKKKQPYIPILEDAFKKASSKDLKRIDFLTRENNPTNLDEIYHTYLKLRNRQERIKPLLPLHYLNSSKKAVFKFSDYTNEVIESKKNLATFLYKDGTTAFQNAKNKNDFRNTHETLSYLESIYPNYKNTRSLLDQAHTNGIEHVFISLTNNTNQIIPRNLENDLLNIATYDLNSFWTVFHTKKTATTSYDYNILFLFNEILISPERIKETHHTYEKEIINEEYLLDKDGNFVLDEHKQKIIIETKEKAICEYYELQQYKNASVQAIIKIIDNNTQQNLNSYPLNTATVFEHLFANYKGDTRALNETHLGLIGSEEIPFPSNEQMIYDSGEDLKNQFKNILKSNRFN
ncbi:hypothetical protein [Aquimarina agarilytica]|uniref:hypothetical protein n=1 Tax=Aquimarina agarilytica TaxID=1087449 RepID=UPI000289DD8A|nr:hypothetical protein [Aquimarina agarilytica]